MNVVISGSWQFSHFEGSDVVSASEDKDQLLL